MDVPNISGYHLIREISSGAFGVVYLAHDIRLDRTVAIKFLKPEVEETRTAVKRFQREAKILARLNHPNIVRVHDVGEIEGFRYIIMDYIQGTPFSKVISEQKISQDQVLRIISMICRALEAAHQEQIVHRDIKPENIMIDTAGRPWLLDFGIARDVGHHLGETLTIEGNILGTPAYMSPEQAGGKSEEVDQRSDIFSLGVVLYHALTGVSPFLARNVLQSIQLITSHTFQTPRSIKPQLNETLEQICLKAMAQDKQDRFQSAAEFAEALEEQIHDKNLFDTSRVGLPAYHDNALDKTLLGLNLTLHFKKGLETLSKKIYVPVKNTVDCVSNRISKRYRLPILLALMVLLIIVIYMFIGDDGPSFIFKDIYVNDSRGYYSQQFLANEAVFIRIEWISFARYKKMSLDISGNGPGEVEAIHVEIDNLKGANYHLQKLTFKNKKPGSYLLKVKLSMQGTDQSKEASFNISPTPVQFRIQEVCFLDSKGQIQNKWELPDKLKLQVKWQIDSFGSGGDLSIKASFSGPSQIKEIKESLGEVKSIKDCRWEYPVCFSDQTPGEYIISVLLEIGVQKLEAKVPFVLASPTKFEITSAQILNKKGLPVDVFEPDEEFTIKVTWNVLSTGLSQMLELNVVPENTSVFEKFTKEISVAKGEDVIEHSYKPQDGRPGDYTFDIVLSCGDNEKREKLNVKIVPPLSISMQKVTFKDSQGKERLFIEGESIWLHLKWDTVNPGTSKSVELNISIKGSGKVENIQETLEIKEGERDFKKELKWIEFQPGVYTAQVTFKGLKDTFSSSGSFKVIRRPQFDFDLECKSLFDISEPIELDLEWKLDKSGEGVQAEAWILIQNRTTSTEFKQYKALGKSKAGNTSIKVPLDFFKPLPGDYSVEVALSIGGKEEKRDRAFEIADIPKIKLEKAETCDNQGNSKSNFWPDEEIYFKFKWHKEYQGGGVTPLLIVTRSSGEGRLKNDRLEYSPKEEDVSINSIPFVNKEPGAYVLNLSFTYGKASESASLYLNIRECGWFREELPKVMSKSKNRGVYIFKKDTPCESIMVYVPQGEFWRGSDSGINDEKPSRQIFLSGFYIDKYEITFKQYRAYVDATGSKDPSFYKNKSYNQDDQPVVGISWEEASSYCKWAGKNLPTEAQWEKAARGGLLIPSWDSESLWIKTIENPYPKRPYPWGVSSPDSPRYRANYNPNKNRKADGYRATAPVGSYSPYGDSPYGCSDMAGNVWEWCQDQYWPDFYARSPLKDPLAPDNPAISYDEATRVIRGGGYKLENLDDLRVSRRRECKLVLRHYPDLGFRGTVPGISGN